MRISDCISDVCSSDLPHRALVVTQDHRNDLAGGWRQVKTGADFLTGMRPQIGQSVAQIVGRSDPIKRGGYCHRHQRRRRGGKDEGAGAIDEIALDEVRAADERTLDAQRSEEHTSELQSLMRISYAVFCLKKKTIKNQ